MIRVNQAGEYGAKRIYEGQLAVLGKTALGPTLEHMKAQETEHLKRFNDLLISYRVRPTLFQPLWHVAGYALGVGTALLGERAAMTCTIAVEEVIDAHYEGQLNTLKDQAPELSELIAHCQEEEREHMTIAAEHSPPYPILAGTIRTISRVAIWCSTRL